MKNELFILGEEFNREEREGDFNESGKKTGYTGKFYAKLLEMGSFEELIEIFLDMKKNNEKEKGGIFYGRFEKEAGEKAEVEQG